MVLAGFGIACATNPTTYSGTFNAMGMVFSFNPTRSLRGNAKPDVNNGTEPETMLRSFALATDTLPRFDIADLSTALNAGERFESRCLSQDGAVLGTVFPPVDAATEPRKRPAPHTFAARWENGRLQRLPIPPGVHRVVAGDMNDLGDVASVSIAYRHGKPSLNRVVLYPRNAPYQNIGTLATDGNSSAAENAPQTRGVSEELVCLNNRGTLIALVGRNSWCRRSDKKQIAIHDGIVFDLNSQDTAVGFANTQSTGAALWKHVTDPDSLNIALLPMGKSPPQENPSNWRGCAESINEKGDTVVAVMLESMNGVRRSGRTAYYLLRDKKLQLIAQMRGAQRAHTRINAQGDVVGFTDTDPQTQITTPMLYHGRKMYDLTYTEKKAGWRILAALDVNDKGQILAYGTNTKREGVVVPLLLTPRSTSPRTETMPPPNSRYSTTP